MLLTRGVDVTYAAKPAAVHALRGVDLDVPDGTLTAILGPSGCGKTTLLRVLAGFLRPTSGEVVLQGRVLTGPRAWVKPERRGIGIVAQEGVLFPHVDVGRNVGFGLTAGAAWLSNRRERRRRIGEVLDLVGLAGFERRRPEELSGGQQQRVALARALAPAPQVVLLDEPFSAVDASLRLELGQQITDLLRHLGTTAVLVTHDQAEALSLADRVAVMRDGRVVQTDTPDRLYARPIDRDTASFVGEVVLLPGRLEARAGRRSARVACALGEIPLQDGATPVADENDVSACTVMLRPEQLQLSPDGVTAQVTGRHFYGHDATLTLRLGIDGAGPEVLLRTRGSGVPEVGASVSVTVAGGALTYP